MMAAIGLVHDPRYHVSLTCPTHVPFENNLHHIVNDFMAGNYDYWMSIDADNPPASNPLDLIAYDRDIMGLPTPVWHYVGKEGEQPIYWNAYRYDEDALAYRPWLPQEGLQKVDAVGTGCFIVARRVFEDFEMRKGPFLRKTNPDGTVERGNDLAFCERATARGHEIWCHFDYHCMHFSELELTEVIRAFTGLDNT